MVVPPLLPNVSPLPLENVIPWRVANKDVPTFPSKLIAPPVPAVKVKLADPKMELLKLIAAPAGVPPEFVVSQLILVLRETGCDKVINCPVVVIVLLPWIRLGEAPVPDRMMGPG